VLTVSGLLIILGAAGFVLLECWTGSGTQSRGAGVILDGLFQSVTARTAGFNTVDVGALSAPTQMVLILLMFIGGSPASTAGGIKTVTFAVVIMAAYATLRKRSEVEIFRRSVRMAVVGKAITIALLFVAMLIGVSLALSVSESANRFEMSQIIFEVASALGTVGLSTGITPALTAAGKLLIIATMLIGKLGPLTLLASLMLDTRPVRYNYPEEAVVVG
jgi:trk system potassium uptake protein TrkH